METWNFVKGRPPVTLEDVQKLDEYMVLLSARTYGQELLKNLLIAEEYTNDITTQINIRAERREVLITLQEADNQIAHYEL